MIGVINRISIIGVIKTLLPITRIIPIILISLTLRIILIKYMSNYKPLHSVNPLLGIYLADTYYTSYASDRNHRKRYIATSGVALFYAQSITPLQHYRCVMPVMLVMIVML